MLTGLEAATAVVGALSCLGQRHVKRLLAFSTISHVGILLATLGGIDEIGLRGRGRDIWPTGIAFAVGGLLLAGVPWGVVSGGTELIDAASAQAGQDWVRYPVLLADGLTGGAVLRVAGRVFLGWGEVDGEEERAPSDEEAERANRPLWLMLVPAGLLLLLALVPA